MTTYQLIGLLGLLMGLFTAGTLFWEYFRSLNRKKLLTYGGIFLLSLMVILVTLGRDVSLLAAYGQPGLNVLETEVGGKLITNTTIAVVFMLGLFIFMYRGGRETEVKGRLMGHAELPFTHTLMWGIRIYIAILFTFSGFVKVNDYIGFSYKLEEYFQVFAEATPFLAGFWGFWEGLSLPLSWAISVFEMGLAMAILVGWHMRTTALLTLLMMIFFTFLTGYSAVTGKVTDCGCFGDALKLAPWESFTKDLIYMIMLVPLFLVRKHIKPIPNNLVATVITAVVVVGSGAYAFYCHENLPQVDYRAYRAGTDLNICTTQPGPDGLIKCKDWDEIYYKDFVAEAKAATDSTYQKPGPIAPLSGTTLMVIMYDMTKTDEAALKASGELARSLQGTGLQVLGATSTGPSQVAPMVEANNLPYPFSFRDATMLKTIVRSNPGYMLLKEGVVVKKWHHNNAPDKAEIEGLLR
jgi:uncharacterized membrane protein YphA (DoxX/SURF4 family)